MKRWLWLVMFALLPWVSPPASAQDPYTHFFNETFGNFAEELQMAREQGKKGIVLFFEMDDCPFCHYMKQQVLNQPEVQAYFREHFLSFPVDVEGDIEISDFHGAATTQKALASASRVRATPVIAFYDLEGNEIFRHTGRTSGMAEFMLMGKYVVEGVYHTMRFTKYKREQFPQ